MGKREGIIRDSDQMLLEQFTAYFRLYENPLYNFALKTVQSEILARDIIQEVFIKLWSIRERFSQIDNMEDYLYRMVRNKVMDVLRQLANDRKLRTEYFNGHQWEDTNVYDTIVLKEYEVALSEAVSQLPPQRRIIYQLSHVEGKSRKEIASKLNISPSTVKNQLTAAMAYLRSVIKDHVKLF
ncbi:RNA polymerase sigma-70 factor [Chitinophaga caeni]|nr:RNA polymerase sigma-70 factor [Chitinophaga caeni]